MKPTYDELVKSLEQALNFIEHDQANRGKATSDVEWDHNVAEYRKHTSGVGIGRSYTNKAYVDLAKIRDQLARTKET